MNNKKPQEETIEISKFTYFLKIFVNQKVKAIKTIKSIKVIKKAMMMMG